VAELDGEKPLRVILGFQRRGVAQVGRLRIELRNQLRELLRLVQLLADAAVRAVAVGAAAPAVEDHSPLRRIAGRQRRHHRLVRGGRRLGETRRAEKEPLRPGPSAPWRHDGIARKGAQ